VFGFGNDAGVFHGLGLGLFRLRDDFGVSVCILSTLEIYSNYTNDCKQYAHK
jgi:hypothetical protein